MNHYKVIGLMSGTSLDGVDIAFCELTDDKVWSFELKRAETIPYDEKWKNLLENAHHSTAEEISELNFQYGAYLGNLVKVFCEKNRLQPDFISSHGHTIFHNPRKGYTLQLGSGASLAAHSGFQVICDFRSTDVALGGQGAPLVPIGDKLLFPDAAFCLNLGGIANISFDKNGDRIAYDLCACNIVLNKYAMKLGSPYDSEGNFASKGMVNKLLLEKLSEISFYKKPFPKSLGREDVEQDVFPILEKSGLNVEDILATFCEHIALEISSVVNELKKSGNVLITGGGAFNNYLINRLKKYLVNEIQIPERKIIEFKEAIIFAFLGVLRIRNELNCLKSVTGSSKDNCGGAIYKG